MSTSSGLYFRLTGSPTTAESVLGYLLELGGEETTESEVRASLELPRSSTSAALSALVQTGVVSTTRRGRTILYRADTGNPLVRQLKIATAIHTSIGALQGCADMIELAVLFGSAARGEDHAESDIDLFVVTRQVDDVLSALTSFPRIQAVVVTPGEHMRMLADETSFVKQTARGITLIGA